MPGAIVVGAGGHGKVVADVLLSAGEDVDGFVDDAKPAGTRVLGLPVLGDTDWLLRNPGRIALGLGDNARRAAVAERLERAGCVLVTAVHAHATVALSADLAGGVVVMARAVVNPAASVGRGAIVNTSAIVEHDCIVGDFAHLSPAAALGGAARVGALAHVGLGAVVLPGVSVGDRAIVGAGAAVVRNVGPDVVVRGVPARFGRQLG